MLRSREAAGLAEVANDAYNSPRGEEQSGSSDSRTSVSHGGRFGCPVHDASDSPRGEKRSLVHFSRACAARFYAMYRACDWQAPVGWVVLLFLLICIRLMLVFLRSV